MSAIRSLGVAADKYAHNSIVSASFSATIHVPEGIVRGSSTEIFHKYILNYTGSRDPLQFIERVEDLSEAY
uniref:Uncharacterized protein n=1 Tax=Glossina palpalis gambiensis TaxID=67801 RepID=A0A1B0BTG5_9MUSC